MKQFYYYYYYWWGCSVAELAGKPF